MRAQRSGRWPTSSPDDPQVRVVGVSRAAKARPTRARLTGEIAAVVLLATGAVLAAAGPSYWAAHPAAAASTVFAVASWAIVGVLWWRTDVEPATTVLILAHSSMTALSWVFVRNSGPWPVIGECANTMANFCGASAIVTHICGGTFTRPVKAWIAGAAVLFATCQGILLATTVTAGRGYGATVWWPTLPMTDAMRQVLLDAALVGYSLLLVTSLPLIARTRGSMARAQRERSLPWIAGWIAMVLINIAHEHEAMRNGYAFVHWVAAREQQVLILPLLPLALLATASRSAWQQLLITWRLSRQAATLTHRGLQDQVRTALRDPTLAIWLWSPAAGAFVDADGRLRGVGGNDSPARRQLHITTAEGLIAVWDIDPSVLYDLPLAHAAAAASLPSLTVIRTRNEAVESVRQLQGRLLEAEQRAREAVARDLHDGVQQQLLSLRFELKRSARQDTIDQTRGLLGTCEQRVCDIQQEIRRLARGISPPSLTDGGLAAAVEELADNASCTVRMDIPERRFSPAFESMVYFFFAEGLTNALKHGRCATVWLSLRPGEHATLVAEVRDDGHGGARVAPGGGLAGLADRLSVMRGRLEVHSPPGGGTRLAAHLTNS
ncbi:MAG: histidine kinase [Austwickia sp.]|nr:histidine kinase [Austwickia sp.]